MKRVISLLVAIVFLVSLVTVSVSKQAPVKAATKKVSISFLNAKPEIAEQLDKTIKNFNKTYPNIKVTVIPLGGQKVFEKASSLYSSGNAPNIMLLGQEFKDFQSKLLDLTGEPWVKKAFKGTLDMVTVKGKVYGAPLTVEAFGFIYNKTVLDKAYGGKFDPAKIKTQKDFEAMLAKVKKANGEALHVSPMDWSLGAHLSNIFFTAQSNDAAKRKQFIADLKAGKVQLDNNKVFKGWLNTFDLMKEFNNAKAAPLAPTYDDGPLTLGSGQVGAWFMGNWATPQLLEAGAKNKYGFLPVPISNNASDYGNSQISVGVPSYLVVDKSQATKDEQAASKTFLKWLLTSKAGQADYVKKLNLIPAYDGFASQPSDSLSQSVLSYLKKGQTLEWMNNQYPADAWPAMGASMQKYLDGKISKSQLANELEAYWKKAK